MNINNIVGLNVSTNNLNNIHGLSIINKQTEYLPVNLGEKFQNLIALRVKDGRLKKIDKDDLKSMPKLKFVDFDSNDLKVIEKNLFQYNTHLECIQLDANHIKSVGQNVFTNLHKLIRLDMSFTDCVKGRAFNIKAVKTLIIDIEKNCNNDIAYYNYLDMKNDIINSRCLDLLKSSESLNAKLSINEGIIKNLNESLVNLQDKFFKNYTQYSLYESTLEAVETRLRLDIIALNRITAKEGRNSAANHTLSMLCGWIVLIIILGLNILTEKILNFNLKVKFEKLD